MPSIEPATTTTERTSNGIIDRRVFQGIVDLNDKDSTDFSTQMVTTYIAVATSTLSDMDKAGNRDIPKLSLLAVSLQDTSDAIGVTEVRRSCFRLQQTIRMWSEETGSRKTTGAGSIDEIIAVHEQLRRNFAIAKSWLTRYVETGNIPDDETARGMVTVAIGGSGPIGGATTTTMPTSVNPNSDR
ncbi:hypothetical protein BJV74DRAFT_588139 [Russula compacta]|nr:hypothetical protein BJV74DRAFT_588139 [Russula compacta]